MQEKWSERFAEYDHRYGQPSTFPADIMDAVKRLCEDAF
jgi:hypothetical protein